MKLLQKVKDLLADERVRGYLYRLGLALGVFLVGKEVITQHDLELFEALATALLGLATAKTSVSKVD